MHERTPAAPQQACLRGRPPRETGISLKLDERQQREFARHVLNGVDGVASQVLVDDHAEDAHHRSATVVALGVQLVVLDRRVSVADPRNAVAHDIPGLPVGVLREERVVEDGNERDNLRPSSGWERLPRRDSARRNVLEGHWREGEVGGIAIPLVARTRGNHVQDGKHGDAAVLDLHLLPAAVLDRVVSDQVQRVEDAERAGGANIARRDDAHLRLHDGRADGDAVEAQRKGDDRQHG
mmetsp:Transcript_17766/g.26764  ORF Transcript_17766/g.26764 Transcript_17766/m.26764 type:complete len:238 (-) Transcript_17766:38-751(-)